MAKYIVKRVLSMIPLLFVVSVIVFMFIHLIPGDPARQIAGVDATIGEIDNIRRQLGQNIRQRFPGFIHNHHLCERIREFGLSFVVLDDSRLCIGNQTHIQRF